MDCDNDISVLLKKFKKETNVKAIKGILNKRKKDAQGYFIYFGTMKSSSPHTKSILTAEDQPVSFAELFFDLVFVFCVTQVVHLLDHAFDWVHLGRAILVFWLVWWAWTQFTWALNAADTKHDRVQMATLVATALAFFMAVSVPHSFDTSSWWFGLTYVAVRGIGLLIYLWVSWPNENMRSAVRSFGAFSILGLMAVLVGGFLGGELQYWFWGLAIALDVFAATVGANKEGWGLHPNHFVERHGLFIIIAMGETLIVAASGATKEAWDGHLMLVAALSVGITSCLWWLYFYRIKDRLEHAMARRHGIDQSSMARDVFSLFHFPMVCGLIIYAYAIEQAMLHPKDPLTLEGRIALSVGVGLYAISIVIAYWRAVGKILWTRVGLAIVFGVIVFGRSGIDVSRTLMLCLGGLLLLCALENKEEKEIQL
ncbi:MAG TPA: low temperature requirement protein A [Saprospiraceae bacterium]